MIVKHDQIYGIRTTNILVRVVTDPDEADKHICSGCYAGLSLNWRVMFQGKGKGE